MEQIATERPSFRQHFQAIDPLAHLFVKQAHTADELGLLLRQARSSKFTVASAHSSSHTNRTPCIWNEQLPQLVEQQLDAAEGRVSSGHSTRPIRLVVIDSIAAPYRSEAGSGGASSHRTLELLSHGARLKKLANAGGPDNSIAVVRLTHFFSLATHFLIQT